MSGLGWLCPICGGVFSPFTPRCLNCYGKIPTFTTTSVTIAPHVCTNCGQLLTPKHRCTVGVGEQSPP